MKNKKKLKYHFINPNSEEATIDAILKVMIEAKAWKVEEAIKKMAEVKCEEVPT